MPRRIRLAFLWHMHQPSYWDPERGEFLLPWTRLHATKDYVDMVRILEKFPRIRATFNLTPSLLDQLDQIGAGVSDPYLDVARKSAASLTESDRAFLVTHFFDLHHERMLEPYPRYRELRAKAGLVEGGGAVPGAKSPPAFTTQDLLDLQVWFHLAWVDPSFRAEEPLRSLVEKGSGFTEVEKQSLLDWGVRCAGSVAEICRAAAEGGRIELTTSAYHHPILPLLIDSDAPREVSSTIPLPVPPFRFPRDAEKQVQSARSSHERRFGAPPRGTWPPEGAVSDAALATIARAAFTWAASDETVLAAALARRDGGLRDWPRELYRPWRIETEGGPLTMVFRDRKLSDLIGFTYSHWDPGQAAEDFVRRVHEAAQNVGPDETALVTVILDGENCWESYLDDGNPFLEALYRRLESDSEIATVTLSQAIEEVPVAAESLRHVPVGSWIRPDLGIWVGHPDKNRAWGELSRARRVAEEAGRAGLSPDRLAGAFEAIDAAEASDWFWWYGPEHPSAHRDAFDRLFRARLQKAYAELGFPAPPSLEVSLREDAIETTPDRVAMEEGREPVPYVRAVLDGRETDFFEWRDAARHEPAGATGAMHQVTGPIETVRFGTDGKSLFLRVDARGGWSATLGSTLTIEFAGASPRVARADLGRASSDLAWSGGEETKDSERAGLYVRDAILEIEIPLRRAVAVAGAHLPFRLTLERNGQPEQVVPASGWLSLPVPLVDLDLTIWSAL